MSGEGEAICLVRATDGKTKLSTEVCQSAPQTTASTSAAALTLPACAAKVGIKDHVKFQIALGDMLKLEMDGLKKRERTDKRKTEKKARAGVTPRSVTPCA